MHANLASFLQVVGEFLRALVEKRTYSISKNWYCWFGILWGTPIPIVTIAIDLYAAGFALSLSNIIKIVSTHPFHLFFLLHPVFFGIVFGAMGTVRHHKEERIEESERNLIGKNAELELANKKLQEVDKLKSDFLSMVSHELRTPLTTIQGYISFLRSEKSGDLSQLQRDCLKISEDEADFLNRLIEELLDISKIEAGRFKVKLAGVDMAEVARKAVLSLQLYAGEQGVTIENKVTQGLPGVWADAERILQVVTNLIENAVKFNRKGGRVSITASALPQNNKVLFCVSDTGIGIPEEMCGRIFDKFYQVDSSGTRRYGGCGLGLAISESILKLHHGRIWVESELGVGSKFFFELPRYGGQNLS